MHHDGVTLSSQDPSFLGSLVLLLWSPSSLSDLSASSAHTSFCLLQIVIPLKTQKLATGQKDVFMEFNSEHYFCHVGAQKAT